MKTVEFYYDLVSPYSYLAHGEVSRIGDERGAQLSLGSMLLGRCTTRRAAHRDVSDGDPGGRDPWEFRRLKG